MSNHISLKHYKHPGAPEAGAEYIKSPSMSSTRRVLHAGVEPTMSDIISERNNQKRLHLIVLTNFKLRMVECIACLFI
jgi:hypothetical protein